MSIDFRGTNFPLGIRNNNPGNLRPGHDWQGMVGENKGFVVFENIHYGIRALAMDLINKYLRGLNTVEKIINVYAPPSENDTDSYIEAVCKRLVCLRDAPIKLSKPLLIEFVKAIIMHENGIRGAKVLPDMIAAGIALVPEKLLKRLNK